MTSMEIAVEMVRASINKRPGRMLKLWLRATGRRRVVAFALADLAAGMLQGAAEARGRRSGDVLNRILREQKRRNR